MSSRLKRFNNLLHHFRVEFIKNSLFYRLSLDKRSTIFDTTKFITDPWEGDLESGKNILAGKFITANSPYPIDIASTFASKNWRNSRHISSFFWLRDLQAVGGNNSRKYGQKLISAFINGYRKTRKFWKYDEIWSCDIIGERIVNWILSYTFFASGSSDRFQKEMLSSINEQYSHLRKCYKAETNPYLKLVALKGLLFVLSTTRAIHKKKILNMLNEVCSMLDRLLAAKSPVDIFHVFRNLLEIRFIIKTNNIELPAEFNGTLSKLAANIRFLRLGSGQIAQNAGTQTYLNSFIPTPRIIDTALSIVDIRDNASKNFGIERLATKKSILIINTTPHNTRSQFNNKNEQGINIFDFEASLGINKVICRSDISVLYNNHRLKLGKAQRSFHKKKIDDLAVFFEGEMQDFNRHFKFAIRREFKNHMNKARISGTDFIFLSNSNSKFFLRFILDKKAKLNQIDERNILININQSDYIFNFVSKDFSELVIRNSAYPSIELVAQNKENNVECMWMLEERNG